MLRLPNESFIWKMMETGSSSDPKQTKYHHILQISHLLFVAGSEDLKKIEGLLVTTYSYL